MFPISKPSVKKNPPLQYKLGWRFYFLPVCLTIWFGFLFARLINLHLSDTAPRNNIRFHKVIHASRGTIYDRNGNPIAVNKVGWKIFIDPIAENRKATKRRPAADPVASCKRVADLTGRTFQEVWRDLYTTNFTDYFNPNTGKITRRYRQYVPQGETFDPTAVDIITNRTLYINNIGLEQIEKRSYPQGRYFSHILGFVTGQRLIGMNGGIEQRYDDMLQGTDGRIEGIRANNGPEIRERRISSLDPINGASIYLTIDHNIQYLVYNALTNAMAEWSADAARAIVQKVDTGEILAMVSIPDYDPNNWKDASGIARKNRTITDQYDPGSTMKAVTVSSALTQGIITPDSTYDVGNRSWRYGGGTLRDHVSGVIDVRTIIAKSSNIGAAKIALDLGDEAFYNYLLSFGFRTKTGIDLPGEAYGMLDHYKTWRPIKPTRVAIGQGIAVTPIQMINAYTTIANGGKRMRPYVMRQIISEDGEILQENQPRVINTPIKPEVAKQMREMLALVVSPQGTARRAQIPGYTVAGKTGTAQIVKPEGGYYERKHWTSFVGFLPAENPVFTVLVLLDNPHKEGKSHDAGVSAAPVFRDIASATAQYLEIPIITSEE